MSDGVVVAAHALRDRRLDEPGDVHSVTKSVLATVVLCAVRDGRLTLDATLGALLGERVPPARRPARVRDLLAMTGGAHCAGLADFDRVMELPGGWVDALLAEPQQHPPGAVFHYDNGAAHLLAAAAHAATGDLIGFATRCVFDPLGIEGWDWPRDPDGIPLGCGGLHLSAYDMASLGEAWRTDALGLGPLLTSATTAHSAGGLPEELPYGWLFWIDEIAGRAAFLAAGWCGQYVLVVPAARLTAVATGDPDHVRADPRSTLHVLRTLVDQSW